MKIYQNPARIVPTRGKKPSRKKKNLHIMKRRFTDPFVEGFSQRSWQRIKETSTNNSVAYNIRTCLQKYAASSLIKSSEINGFDTYFTLKYGCPTFN